MSLVTVSGLHKNYDSVKAVDGVSFEIEEREIFGLLGPNGAGKTTTINALCTYTEPTTGEVVVAGPPSLQRERSSSPATMSPLSRRQSSGSSAWCPRTSLSTPT